MLPKVKNYMTFNIFLTNNLMRIKMGIKRVHKMNLKSIYKVH